MIGDSATASGSVDSTADSTHAIQRSYSAPSQTSSDMTVSNDLPSPATLRGSEDANSSEGFAFIYMVLLGGLTQPCSIFPLM